MCELHKVITRWCFGACFAHLPIRDEANNKHSGLIKTLVMQQLERFFRPLTIIFGQSASVLIPSVLIHPGATVLNAFTYATDVVSHTYAHI